jgi:hypothetical protein
MGWWLSSARPITHYFATPLTPHDTEKYKLLIGDAKG